MTYADRDGYEWGPATAPNLRCKSCEFDSAITPATWQCVELKWGLCDKCFEILVRHVPVLTKAPEKPRSGTFDERRAGRKFWRDLRQQTFMPK